MLTALTQISEVLLYTKTLNIAQQFNICHPEVFDTYAEYTILFSQTQQSLIYYLLELGRHVSIPLESSSGPSTKMYRSFT